MKKNYSYTFRNVLCIIAIMIVCCGCGAKTPDYGNSADFENALNNGENVVGKIVTFNVLAISPDSRFGYDLWSGEHLNFCSEETWDVQRGDELTVKILSVAGVGDSYIIRYKMLSDVGEKTSVVAEEDKSNPFSQSSNVGSVEVDAKENDRLLADSVHMAFLTAMMDPMVMTAEDYEDSIGWLQSGVDITGLEAFDKMKENSILQEAAEIMDVNSFASVSYMLQSPEATGKIFVTVTGANSIKVEIEGTDIVIE